MKKPRRYHRTRKSLPDGFEKFLPNGHEHYVFRLYVTGATGRSARAIINIKKLCQEHLAGRYELEVIDIYQQPELAKDDQIFASPTLIRSLPKPLRRFIGDLSQTARILVGMNLPAQHK